MKMPARNMVEIVDLAPSDALLPLFECLSNSIISLSQSRLPPADRQISVKVSRGEPLEQASLLDEAARTIKNITVTDNGIGFNEKNYLSFETPHSNELRHLGCLGVGRFTVLACFRKMKIRSNYPENGGWKYREFEFDSVREIKKIALKESESTEALTTVELRDCFNHTVLNQTAVSLDEIARRVMEQFLVFYLSKNLPQILISDDNSPEGVCVNDLYSEVAEENERGFDLSGQAFRMYVTRNPRTSNRKYHYVRYCANSRVVGQPRNIGRLNSLFSYPLRRGGDDYFLDVFVVGDYLDKKKTPTRNAFRIPQEPVEQEFLIPGDPNISFDGIEREIVHVLTDEYEEHVKQTQERVIEEWQDYIDRNPGYKSFQKDQDLLKSLPANLPDDKKDEQLHRIAYTERKKVEIKIQDFIENKQVNQESIEEIVDTIRTKTAFDSDSLAAYMIRRKAVIELFEKFLDADRDGKYKLEEDVHQLIFPMGGTTKNTDYEAHNLWLLDERLVGYHFIASDRPIRSWCDVDSGKEPDLIMIEDPPMFDNPIGFADQKAGDLSSMVIFEFKRPGETASNQKKDNRWEFSDLTDKYFDAFLYGKQTTNDKGRSVTLQNGTPKFGYIILDVIPKDLAQYNIDSKGWKKTPFNTYYKMVEGMNLYLETMTFNTLIEAAKKRHNPFFSRLFVKNEAVGKLV